MTTLTVNIDKATNAKDIIKYLKSLNCVKSIALEKHTINKTDTNWAVVGRPASDEELDTLFDAMDNDPDEGITSNQMVESVKKWKKKYA